MKDSLQIIGTVILVIAFAFALMFGFVKLFEYRDSTYKKEAEAGCKQVVELVDIKEFEVDSEYNCLFVKDGKLVRVKDW